MTCGTHTTANVTAAAFGFNPLLSGSFLKRRDSCECTICSLFRSYHPCRVQRGQARGTDTQIVILTRALSLSFFLSTFFFLSFLFFAFYRRAGRPTAPLCERAGHAGPGVPSVLYFGGRGKLVALILSPFHDITHQLHLPDAQGYCQYAQLPPCVCMCVCMCVCVYIYKKRE